MKFVRIAGIMAAVLLAGALVFFIWQEKAAEREKETVYVEMEKELRPLELEKRKLRQELDDLEKVYDEESQGMASLILLFADIDRTVYTEIFPKMKEYGFIGVLALSGEQIPGQEGCISKEQFDELMEAGWQCCTKWERNMTAREWKESVDKLVAETGITRPSAVYFPQGAYDSKLDNYLSSQGITIVVHHGEEGLSLTLPENGETLWHPGAIPWHQDGSRWELSGVVTERGNMVFVTGLDSTEEEYSESGYISMLEDAKGYCESGELMVTDLKTACEYRGNLEDSQEGLSQNFEEKKAELDEQIEEVDRQIDGVTQKYVKE